jgi:hypothetical protein
MCVDCTCKFEDQPNTIYRPIRSRHTFLYTKGTCRMSCRRVASLMHACPHLATSTSRYGSSIDFFSERVSRRTPAARPGTGHGTRLHLVRLTSSFCSMGSSSPCQPSAWLLYGMPSLSSDQATLADRWLTPHGMASRRCLLVGEGPVQCSLWSCPIRPRRMS